MQGRVAGRAPLKVERRHRGHQLRGRLEIAAVVGGDGLQEGDVIGDLVLGIADGAPAADQREFLAGIVEIDAADHVARHAEGLVGRLEVRVQGGRGPGHSHGLVVPAFRLQERGPARIGPGPILLRARSRQGGIGGDRLVAPALRGKIDGVAVGLGLVVERLGRPADQGVHLRLRALHSRARLLARPRGQL